MDRDVHLASPRARPPPRPPSFVFVTACFLLCTATGRLFVKVRSQDVFQRKSELLKELVGPEMWDVCSLMNLDELFNHLFSC